MQIQLFKIVSYSLKGNRRYVQNLTATFFSQGITALSLFILTPRLLRFLGEERLNEYWVILNLVVVAAVLDLGQSVGLSHRLIQRKRNYSVLVTSIFFGQAGIWLISIPLLFLIFHYRLVNINGNSFQFALLASLILFQNIVALLFDGVLQSFNKIYVSKWLRAGRTLVEMGLIFWFVKSASVSTLLLITVIINCVYLFLLYYFSVVQFPFYISRGYFNYKVLIGHLKYSSPYLMTILAGLIAFNVQILLLQSILVTYAMAIFLLVFRFFEVIRLALTNFTLILFPSISDMQSKGNWEGVERLFYQVLKRVAIFSALVLTLIYFFGEAAFTLWSGYAGQEVSALFYFSIVYTFLLVLDHVSVVFQYSLNIQAIPAVVSIVQSLISLLLTVCFVKTAGVVGALFASLLSFVCISFIFNPLFLLKRIRQNRVQVS